MTSPRPSTEPSGPGEDPGTRQQHDEHGASGPYVASGYDESGTPVPAVPHEALLGRIAVSLLLGQTVVLAAVAVAGYVLSTTATEPSPVRVLGLGMNIAHATLLAVTAVLGAAATVARRWLRRYALLQTVDYMVVFLGGITLSLGTPDRSGLNLGGPDHLLHGLLALLGFVIAVIGSARVVEPPPAPPAYGDDRAGSGRAG